MDPEVRKLLEETHALTRDNHRLLRAVRRHQIIETFGKWVLWLILIVASGYAYVYYFGPVLNSFVKSVSGNSSGGSIILPSSELQKLLHSYNTGS